MAFNGSGVFNRLYSWVNDAAANIKIRADRMDNEMNGFATGLSTCITKDGQTTITANLPMAGFKHTGVADGSNRTDYASFGQVQDGKLHWVAAGGTADAITATYSTPITALVDGQLCYVRAANTNATTTPTFSPNGLTARTITQRGGAALAAGDITAATEMELRYNLANTRWEWLNPTLKTINLTSTTLVATSAQLAAAISDEYGAGRAIFETGLAQVAGGRLTLSSGSPVTTSDLTAQSTLYYTPYLHDKIAVYTSGAWKMYTFTERSIALSGLTSGRPYDVFLYDNAGTLTMELLAWTNDTTRATGITRQDGVVVKSGDATRRLLGTIYTTSTTTTEDSLAKRYVWNMNNRVTRRMLVTDATASWTYSTATIRQANGSTANQLDWVSGLSEETVAATLNAGVVNSTSTLRGVLSGFGYDTTAGINIPYGSCAISNVQTTLNNAGVYISGVGRHYLAWLEYGAGADTQTWYGGSQRGISGIQNM